MLSLYNTFSVYQTQDIVSHTTKSPMVKPKYSQSKISIRADNLLMDMLLIHIDHRVIHRKPK